jgi:MerR family copper efflux transcriptional regulator
MAEMTIGEAAQRSGWSPRMLRYLESAGILSGTRSSSRYRLYGDAEIELLTGLTALRKRFGFALTDIAFAVRLRREPALRNELGGWLEAAHGKEQVAWLDWEQRKHAHLLAA